MKVDSLAEQLFFTTVRIETVGADGSQGAGTGFFLNVDLGNGTGALFIVTNKHVVAGSLTGTISFHRSVDGLPKTPGFQQPFEDFEGLWFGHPDADIDIAITPYLPIADHIRKTAKVELFIKTISSNHIPTPEMLEELDAIESVTFIGYPSGIWDTYHLLPIARRGTTASPINVDFENKPRFLIDASVFGGSSGSPVFVFDQGIYSNKKAGAMLGNRAIFVGVVSSVYFRTQLNRLIAVPIPTVTQPMAQSEEMLDLGVVIKARMVRETVDAYLRLRPPEGRANVTDQQAGP